MAKEHFDQTAPNAGEVDLNKAQVENAVAEPTQGSTTQSPDDTVASDEEASTASSDEQVQATPGAGPEDLKADAYELVSAVDQQERDNLMAYLSGKGLEAKVVLKYDLKKLMAAAIILVAYAANRKVDEKHVDKLLQSLKKSGKKRFSEPITACLAKTALMSSGVSIMMTSAS